MKEKFFTFLLIVLFVFMTGCNSERTEKETVFNEEILQEKNGCDYGNSIVWCEGKLYFYDDDNNDFDFNGAVYSIDEYSGEKKKITEAAWKTSLYKLDSYIFVNGFVDEKEVILRISTDSGKVENILKGTLCCIDREKSELYYSYHYDLDGEYITTIFKSNIDGESIKPICSGRYDFLRKDGDLIYLMERPINCTILASVKSDGSDLKKIAEIPSIYEREPIIDFGIASDWIFLSAGAHSGKGNYFCGGLVRLKKDGTEVERFYDEPIEHFYIIDDWIYFNYEYYKLSEKENWGCWRMRTDLSEKEYLGDRVGVLQNCIDNKFLYCEYSANEDDVFTAINDLRQWDIENNEVITLFEGKNVLLAEDSRYLGYYVTEKIDEFIYFKVWVYGYKSGENYAGHTCYEAFCRVRDNGEDLKILYEEKGKNCS